jgi:hypothetical protein
MLPAPGGLSQALGARYVSKSGEEPIMKITISKLMLVFLFLLGCAGNAAISVLDVYVITGLRERREGEGSA